MIQWDPQSFDPPAIGRLVRLTSVGRPRLVDSDELVIECEEAGWDTSELATLRETLDSDDLMCL